MKFITLKKTNNNRTKMYEEFEEELNKFKKQHSHHDFQLTYYDTDNLVVILNNKGDYNEIIHDKLCETFDVRLQYVIRSKMQGINGFSDKIELFYSPVHHYIKYLTWDEVEL